MKIFLLFLIALIHPAIALERTVTIKGIRNDQGNIALLVFTQALGFPDQIEKAAIQQQTAAKNGEVTLTVKNLPAGPIAIAVLHDEDKSGSLKRNLIGIPLEGVAITGKPLANQPPSYNDSLIDVTKNPTITLTLKYW